MAANPLTPAELAERLFVTPNEAAVILQWDPRTVRRLIHDGDIPATRAGEGTGSSYRIPAQWVRERAALDGRSGQLDELERRVMALEAMADRLREAFGGAA